MDFFNRNSPIFIQIYLMWLFMRVHNNIFFMRNILCLFLLMVLPVCAESKFAKAEVGSKINYSSNIELSEFEKIFEGFSSCKFDGLYLDYNTLKPKNDFFNKRNITSIRFDGDTSDEVYFEVNEMFFGNEVKHVILSRGFHGIVGLTFLNSVESVKNNLDVFMKNNYSLNKSEKRTAILTDYKEMGALSILYCSYGYDSDELGRRMNASSSKNQNNVKGDSFHSYDEECLKFDKGIAKNKVSLFIKKNKIRIAKNAQYYSATFDLNRDQEPEYFYYIESLDFCGSHTGCEVNVFSHHGGNFQKIARGISTGLLNNPKEYLDANFCVLKNTTNGWFDIKANNIVMEIRVSVEFKN
jgi:hypothetical protein